MRTVSLNLDLDDAEALHDALVEMLAVAGTQTCGETDAPDALTWIATELDRMINQARCGARPKSRAVQPTLSVANAHTADRLFEDNVVHLWVLPSQERG